MVLTPHMIIIGIIFLAAVGLTIWAVSPHRFQGLTFLVIWFIGALPELSAALAGWDIDGIIMSFFASAYIYILFSVYLGYILFKRFFPRGAFSRKKIAPAEEEKYQHLALQTIRKDQKRFKE
jgi:hypothetical protein